MVPDFWVLHGYAKGEQTRSCLHDCVWVGSVLMENDAYSNYDSRFSGFGQALTTAYTRFVKGIAKTGLIHPPNSPPNTRIAWAYLAFLLFHDFEVVCHLGSLV